jgi:hypothetical protein
VVFESDYVSGLELLFQGTSGGWMLWGKNSWAAGNRFIGNPVHPKELVRGSLEIFRGRRQR